jgi:hypothetical protein
MSLVARFEFFFLLFYFFSLSGHPGITQASSRGMKFGLRLDGHWDGKDRWRKMGLEA